MKYSILGTRVAAGFVFSHGAQAQTPIQDITNARLTYSSPDCAEYAGRYVAEIEVEGTSRKPCSMAEVAITATDDACVVETNGIANDDFDGPTDRFANDVRKLKATLRIPRFPGKAATPTRLNQGSYDAILLNGPPVDLLSAGCDGQEGPSAGIDGNGTIRPARSVYTPKAEDQPAPPEGPGGKPDRNNLVDDYFAGNGDLDECNDMIVNGVFGYYVTSTYPWILKCSSGTPDPSFAKR
ncbi:MAG: YHYH protein [Pseudomonadota bacterium]